MTGKITIKWSGSTKLVSKQSTVTVTVVNGGAPGDGYASLAILAGSASVSGDFAGADVGASSMMYAETTQTTSQIDAAAGSSTGLQFITLGTDGTHTTPNSLSLG